MSLPGQQRPISTIGTATGLQANFVFKTEPVGGSRLRMVWFFERHKRLMFVYGVRNPVTSQLKRFDKPLAPGLYRAELSVRPPGSSYKRIGTVEARVG